jgi:NAD(P)-dependent dehydrogenase (short-subunit alcohol dehydrogenase family)
MVNRIAIIGCSGAIGRAFTRQLARAHKEATLHAFSRITQKPGAPNIRYHTIDYEDETAIAAAASLASADGPLDLVIVATGLLHEAARMPEKSLRDLSADNFRRLFDVNTILPALVAKHFLPVLSRDHRSVFAALSARVGSVTDNRLGGWYAYRASKAALNMIIRTAAIEVARNNKQAVIVGLHPGTVDSGLSEPFQGNVAEGKLFTPDFAAGRLLEVLAQLTPDHSGRCFAWDGKEIAP